MVNLICLGSGSTGNCYLLKAEEDTLMIEAGIPVNEVCLKEKISRVSGCLVSHEHTDHAKYIDSYMDRGIEIFCSQGTADNIKLKRTQKRRPSILKEGITEEIGSFKVTPFKTVHDAKEPFGFIIEHKDMGKLLFLTDSNGVQDSFQYEDFDDIMIECNYETGLIDRNRLEGRIDKKRYDRTMETHMAFTQCMGVIKRTNSDRCKEIYLMHLSKDNSDAQSVLSKAQEVLGRKVNLAIYGGQL